MNIIEWYFRLVSFNLLPLLASSDAVCLQGIWTTADPRRTATSASALARQGPTRAGSRTHKARDTGEEAHQRYKKVSKGWTNAFL